MRFVIVEDEIRIREGIVKLLARMNPTYEIAGEADNGKEGLDLIFQTNPDVVITDIRMPVMDGLDMLKEAYGAGSKMKTIVLSAYSEFEYARQAIQLGVTEYLLKPIVLNEFQQAIEHVTHQLEAQRIQKPRQLGTLIQIMEGIFSGSILVDEEISQFLEAQYKITKQTAIGMICFYIGALQEEKTERIQSHLTTLFQQRKELQYCMIPSLYEKALIAVIYGYEDGHAIERWIQYQILNRWDKQMHVGIGWIQVEAICDLRKGFDALYPYLDWNMALGEDVVICYPKITKIQTVPCIYPVKIEDRLKLSVCANNKEDIRNTMNQFHQYFQSGQVFAPKEMKECYVRFLWALLNISIEVGFGRDKGIQQQRLLAQIMGAKTRNELKTVAQQTLDCILSEEEQQEIKHLTVKRAVNMVQEFYSTGITLEEIADKLNITPEYLSTQFSKEMGMYFSTYVRNYRMTKAKELLIGTSLKLYEIAEKIGYADAKYFSKVFKDVYGQLPAEYRKSNR